MPDWAFGGLSGTAVATVFAVGATLAVLFFLLRPRPPVVSVSSHVLWEAILPKRRNPLAKELLMLALQILAIGAVALALGDPFHEPEEAAEGDGPVILDRLWVIDRSLSMGALDEAGTSRIDRVAGDLLAELTDLDPRVRVGVIGFSATPELLAPCTDDRGRARLALRLLEVDGVGADLDGALRLAVAQPRLSAATGLVELFSDAPEAAEAAARFTDETGWPVRLRAPFEPRPNVAITAFDLRASEGIPAEEEAVVRLRNHADVPAQVLLRLETQTAILGEARVTMEPGANLVRRYRFLPLEPGGVEAVLREVRFDGAPEGTGRDALPHDDRAFAWIQPVRPLRVMLVTDGNRYLERVLSLLPGAELTRVRPSEYPRRGAPRAAEQDVVFLDGYVPDGAQPPRAFYVNPRPGGPFETLGTFPSPAMTDFDYGHPILSGLVLRDLQILEGSVLVAQDGDSRLVGSPSGPLVLARETASGKAIGWGFDFGRSDLPLRLAFPQIIVNSLLWMREGRAVGEPPGELHRLAEPLWVGPEGPAGLPIQSEPAEVAASGGVPEVGAALTVTDLLREAQAVADDDERGAARATTTVQVGDGLHPLRFARPGLWRVAGPGWSHDVAVNLETSPESLVGVLPPHDGAPVAPPPPAPEEVPESDPLWLWLAMGAGALLLVEFGAYTR